MKTLVISNTIDSINVYKLCTVLEKPGKERFSKHSIGHIFHCREKLWKSVAGEHAPRIVGIPRDKLMGLNSSLFPNLPLILKNVNNGYAFVAEQHIN